MVNANKQGVIAAFGAYLLWGLLPVYFKWIDNTSAFEILAHRVVWSVIFLAIITCVVKEWQQVWRALSNWNTLKWLLGSSTFIALNWLVFIWAVNDGRILETSLGYYINPIINCFLAMLLLGERMRPIQWLAFALAFIGVSIQIFQVGYLPWVTLVLALSFGGYGIIKKKRPVEARVGLFVETLLMLPFAIVYLAYLFNSGEMVFGQSTSATWLLPLAGVLTAVPLLLFTAAANRMPFTVLSFFQYIAPSMTFLLAILVYGETLSLSMLMTFACIWTGLVFYSLDSLRRAKAARRSDAAN